MGWLSLRRPADLGDSEMRIYRLLAFFLLGFLLGGVSTWASAGTVPYKFNGMNVTREGGVTYLRGTSPAEVAAAGVTVSGNTVLSGGAVAVTFKQVTFADAVPLAAGAATVMANAVKLNPAGLLTSAVGGYLLTKGLEYAQGEWKKIQSSPPTVTEEWIPCGTTCWASGTADPASSCYARGGQSLGAVKTTEQGVPTAYYCNGSYGGFTYRASQTVTCPGGAQPVNGQCSGGSTTAVDSDWTAARSGTWPDPAILDMVKNGVPLPTDKAVFTPPYKDIDLSDPYIDPVTGKRFKDQARVTPLPSAPDTADVQVTKQEVDANGQPVTSGGAPVPPVEETDLCKLNPNASGCQPLDDVPDVELPESEITLSISPVSGFGPDSGTCPASSTLFSKGGQPIVWSWQQYCDFASGLRPLIVGFAWLSALMIVIAVARRNT